MEYEEKRGMNMAKSGDEVLGQFTQAAEQEEKSSERRYKIGIIGTGWIAEAHLLPQSSRFR